MNLTGKYVLGMWFVAWERTAARPGSDWFCSVARPEGGEPDDEHQWEIEYRFRYYAPDDTGDAFDGRDEKSWYNYRARTHEATVLMTVRALFDTVHQHHPWGTPAVHSEVLIRGGQEKALELMATRGWSNFKVIPKEQAGG